MQKIIVNSDKHTLLEELTIKLNELRGILSEKPHYIDLKYIYEKMNAFMGQIKATFEALGDKFPLQAIHENISINSWDYIGEGICKFCQEQEMDETDKQIYRRVLQLALYLDSNHDLKTDYLFKNTQIGSEEILNKIISSIEDYK